MDFKLSYNWLKEFVDTTETPERLARTVSLSGASVERVEHVEDKWPGIVVGEIMSIEKHPNADRLSVATVAIGKTDVIPVVFGQMAVIHVGDKVPVAVAPMMLPTGQRIDATTVRGVASQGMLCLDQEIGLVSGGVSMRFFDASVRNGTPLGTALSSDDALFDVEVTSNRIDMFSVLGLARETAAITRSPLTARAKRASETKVPTFRIGENRIPLSIRIRSPKLCRRFSGILMTNVTVAPSPAWMQHRLILAGLRPINNIVDITNYVMLELGKPMHAYDADTLQRDADGGVVLEIRRGVSGETMRTLDNEERTLDPSVVVAADAENVHGIAGIMGGAASAISETTRTVLFESAAWDPLLIRKTARALQLQTDAAQRFEKNIVPESTIPALVHAVELARELAGATVASSLVDYYPKKEPVTRVTLSEETIARYLGISIPSADIRRTLTALGFTVKPKAAKKGVRCWEVTPPWWRAPDVTIPEDLVEEIARIYGYHRLPSHLPASELVVTTKTERNEMVWERNVKRMFEGAGWTEIMSYSFISEDMVRNVGIDPAICLRVVNPLSDDMALMRRTLTPSMFVAIAENQMRRDRLRLFEIAHVYRPQKTGNIPDQPLRLIGAVVGADPFREAKGMAEHILARMGIEDDTLSWESFDPRESTWRDPERSILLFAKGVRVGHVSTPRASVLDAFGIKKPVALFYLRFREILPFATDVKRYVPIPKYPAVERDLAFVVPADVLHDTVQSVMIGHSLLSSCALFDVYTGVGVPEGKKSMAFHLSFQSDERTLTTEEVDQALATIVAALQKSFGAEIRAS